MVIPGNPSSGFFSQVFFENSVHSSKSAFAELQPIPSIFWTVMARSRSKLEFKNYNGEFDPGSGRTLAACLTHASQGEKGSNILSKPANG